MFTTWKSGHQDSQQTYTWLEKLEKKSSLASAIQRLAKAAQGRVKAHDVGANPLLWSPGSQFLLHGEESQSKSCTLW